MGKYFMKLVVGPTTVITIVITTVIHDVTTSHHA